jgi:hypothetical protein
VTALVAAAIALLILNGGDADQTSAPAAPTGIRGTSFSGPGFSIGVPAAWHTLSPAARAGIAGHPVAVLQRADGHGLVVVRKTGRPQNQDLRTLTKALSTRFAKKYGDFSFISARVQRIRGGSAFLYTFLRGKSGLVQSVALTSVGGASYTLDSAVQSDDRQSAAEVAAAVRSFGP